MLDAGLGWWVGQVWEIVNSTSGLDCFMSQSDSLALQRENDNSIPDGGWVGAKSSVNRLPSLTGQTGYIDHFRPAAASCLSVGCPASAHFPSSTPGTPPAPWCGLPAEQVDGPWRRRGGKRGPAIGKSRNPAVLGAAEKQNLPGKRMFPNLKRRQAGRSKKQRTTHRADILEELWSEPTIGRCRRQKMEQDTEVSMAKQRPVNQTDGQNT